MITLIVLLLVLVGCSEPPPTAGPAQVTQARAQQGDREAAGGAGWRAVDGDTIRDPAGRVIRVVGVDSPEMPGHAQCPAEAAAALAARGFTAAALAGAQRIDLRERGTDRYRRALAVVLIDGRDLAELLIQAGLGRPYHGEKRRSWC